jgi:SAM-dependent methyltransferase
MSMTSADQAWAGDRVARWLRRAALLEGQLEPVADVLFAAAALRAGERVLDVGCGTGPTTHRAAREVGRSGRVVGLDISAEMLAAAAAKSEQDGQDDVAPLRWVAADAVSWEPERGAFDVVLSRFGVMFFSDPAAAFDRLATATRPGGRLAMVVWGRRDESDVFAVPLYATLDQLRRDGIAVEVPPADDGPFSMHDPATVTALLNGAGWSDVRCSPHRLVLPVGGGGLDPASAAALVVESGPTGLVIAQLGDEDRAAVMPALTAAIAAAFANHLDTSGNVQLNARILVVTATRSMRSSEGGQGPPTAD